MARPMPGEIGIAQHSSIALSAPVRQRRYSKFSRIFLMLSTAVCVTRDVAFFAQDLLCVPAHTAAEWICATVGHDVMRSKGA